MNNHINSKMKKKLRVVEAFIHATHEIIEDEGLEAVTLRKVADLAGYNSATVYNYFNSLEHLIFFACMQYIDDYLIDLSYYLKDSANSLETYFRTWECFCYKSFNLPNVYKAVFFYEHNESSNNEFQEYYALFPSELSKYSSNIKSMLLSGDIHMRDKILLKPCIDEGFIKKEDFEEISDLMILIYEGMLNNVLASKNFLQPVVITKKTLKYMKKGLKSYVQKEVEFLQNI